MAANVFWLMCLCLFCGVNGLKRESWKKEVESRLSFLEHQLTIHKAENKRLEGKIHEINVCIDTFLESSLDSLRLASYTDYLLLERWNAFFMIFRKFEMCRRKRKNYTKIKDMKTIGQVKMMFQKDMEGNNMKIFNYRSNVSNTWTAEKRQTQHFYQDNIALGKHVSMTNHYTNLPGTNAVDGDASCCSTKCTNITFAASGSYQNNTQWTVDLGKVYNIHNIKIHYRVDSPNDDTNTLLFRGRFAGFSLYISNTTRKKDGFTCYNDLENIPNLPPLVFNIACIQHGRYVIYYNERRNGSAYPNMYSKYAQADLCEVEVFGCQSGVGGYCTKQCPSNCEDNLCDVITGTCLSCKAGWKGPKCNQKCELGKHGPNCLLECSNNCLVNEDCNHVTGKCNGCASGWTGKSCTQVCGVGKYGPSCALDCGRCMDGLTCDRITGYCKECQHGFLPPFCTNRTGNEMTDHIAFYATLSQSSVPGLHIHETIIFDEIKTNTGNGYHGYDGLFIVPKSGLYGFAWSVMVQDQGVSSTEIVVNGKVRGTTIASGPGSGSRDVGTGFVILQVSRDDHVYIRMHESGSGSVVSDARGMSSFSGWMLN